MIGGPLYLHGQQLTLLGETLVEQWRWGPNPPGALSQPMWNLLVPGSGTVLGDTEEVGYQIPGLAFVEGLPGRHGRTLNTFLDYVEDPLG